MSSNRKRRRPGPQDREDSRARSEGSRLSEGASGDAIPAGEQPPPAEPPVVSTIAGWKEIESVTARRRAAAARRARTPLQRRLRPSPRDPSAPRPKRTRNQRILRAVAAVFLLFVVIPSLLLALAYWSAEIPDPSAVRSNQIATVLTADGSTVLATVVPPKGNRTPVPLSDVPQPVRYAMLSAEDRHFYTNPGYDTSAYLRAARDNLFGHDDAGGGSTITQQYVKNAFLTSDRTLSRKMRELIISAKMARQWNKDDILAAYFNTIYYGRGAYGIAAAARAYFGKSVPELTLAEGAVLAAVVRTPALLDPETHLNQLKARWAYVLDGMVEMNWLAPGNRDALVFPPIAPIAPPADDGAQGPAGLIRTAVLRELKDAGISDQEVDTGALRIVTTIDARAQQAALDAVHNSLDGQSADLRSAVVSIDPHTGAVRAYYGGEDGVGFDFAQAPLQTGSAFKTFAVIAALQQGMPLSYQLDSSPVTVNDTKVTNAEGDSCGVCSMAEAFKRSLNTSFYRLTEAVGPKAVADAAHMAGIPEQIPGVPGRTLTEPDGMPTPSIVLGSYSVRPIDMASAYATIAADGIYHKPYFVQQVVAGDGRVLLDRGTEGAKGVLPPGQQRLPRTIADTTIQAMLPIAGYSNGHVLAGGRPVAAKTGTTQLGDTGANKDAWMIGFTPSLSTAVWIGTAQSEAIRAHGAAIWGSTVPADIWKHTMDGALRGTPVEEFPAPPEPSIASGPFWSIAPATPSAPAVSGAPAPSSSSAPGQGPFDVLAPPSSPPPVISFPPAPEPAPAPEPQPEPFPGEIFPGLHVPGLR
ncbi:Monofunctional biosynthetic peptidoglycan transglycosylase [Nocardia sp. RB56]|uniref:Monofunctional biosynthetic peptidoglycan transglycosylase n=1 Tax=Nocardia aurantia TaxID=2585199 RepID=A0A7K0DN46_9NOCA|nr:Monofunctional biosynthetic peptidoglycan transglycosylase [Nocardia aurantia]